MLRTDYAPSPNGLLERVDHGSEFISTVFCDQWTQRAIAIDYIAPSKSNQNGFVERFKGFCRHEVLDDWLTEYNLECPH